MATRIGSEKVKTADMMSEMIEAARSGNRKCLRKMILRGCSLHCRDSRGWTPLHEAAAAGHAQCVQEILSAVCNSSLQRRRDYVNSITNKAVDEGHMDAVKLLIDKDAELKGRHTRSCRTCLHQAVYKGHSDIVRLLVNLCDVEASSTMEITPLYVAAHYGQVECLQILINAGANVNVQVNSMATPLFIATQEDHHQCVDLLLAHGADPNMVCDSESLRLPIHTASEFGHIQVLKSLISVTDRACDRGEDMESPLYIAIYNDQSASVELLLKEGFSPDAQRLTDLEMNSPLAFALSECTNMSECVRLLVAAGATICEDAWLSVLATEKTELLELILQHRWIPSPKTLTQDSSPAPRRNDKTALKLQEVRAMLCVALNQVRFVACWLPLLLKAGLEPSLLLHSCILDKADGEALNYLLEFVNWSTLSTALKQILDQRREEKSWQPHPHFEHVPSLSHLCRLQLRTILGPDLLMTGDVVQQLPVPRPLHHFLQFKDISEASFPFPQSPRINPMRRGNLSHEHVHVL
uniref:Ankyrin repeat and SOCS box containing 3 n=1 Tax=Cynoglossus semilaevis TaxID=244447 RepID=A0A3P8UMY9_CYNSE